MGFPAAAAAVDLLRTSARTRRILASAVRVTALMLHAEAFPQAFLQCSGFYVAQTATFTQ